MNFISIEFLILLSAVLFLYYNLQHSSQNILLLIASYIFYGWWDWRFLSLMFFSSLLDYFCGLAVDVQEKPNASVFFRKIIVGLSIAGNLSFLGFFKYFNFFSYSLERAFSAIGWHLDTITLQIILPVGISFYTFQTMSYTIDVYRGQLRATRKFFDFMLYVSFFPQLVAGPIERGINLLPQVLNPRNPSCAGIKSGIQLAFWGFFKKMVIADNIVLMVDNIFNNPTSSGLEYILATYAFAIQIYCDFSGYTDIARGVARILGFEIRENFNLPYFSKNPSEFWLRWHISLSSWLRDYLYIPLGGNRKGKYSTYRNLSVTMILGGLWHGASWHFVLWGIYQGLLLVIYRLINEFFGIGSVITRKATTLRDWLSILFFFQLTCLGWLIFRVTSVSQLVDALREIAVFSIADVFPTGQLIYLLIFAIPLFSFQAVQYCRDKLELWTNWPIPVLVPLYVVMFYLILLFGTPERTIFIYFQF